MTTGAGGGALGEGGGGGSSTGSRISAPTVRPTGGSTGVAAVRAGVVAAAGAGGGGAEGRRKIPTAMPAAATPAIITYTPGGRPCRRVWRCGTSVSSATVAVALGVSARIVNGAGATGSTFTVGSLGPAIAAGEITVTGARAGSDGAKGDAVDAGATAGADVEPAVFSVDAVSDG